MQQQNKISSLEKGIASKVIFAETAPPLIPTSDQLAEAIQGIIVGEGEPHRLEALITRKQMEVEALKETMDDQAA
jgi:hypothetical protein